MKGQKEAWEAYEASDPGFGQDGWINLRDGVADQFPEKGYSVTSAPAIYKNLVITGAAVADG